MNKEEILMIIGVLIFSFTFATISILNIIDRKKREDIYNKREIEIQQLMKQKGITSILYYSKLNEGVIIIKK